MNKKLLWTILVILALGLGSELAYYWWPKTNQIIAPAVSVLPVPSVSTSVKPITQVSDEGIIWTLPIKLDDLKLILTSKANPKGDSFIDDIEGYYKTADLEGGGELITTKASFVGLGMPLVLRFRKDAQGVYSYLVQQSDEQESSRYKKFLAKNVLVDTETIYQSLSAPDSLTVKGDTLKSSGSNGFFSDLIESNPVEMAETSYGKLYQVKSSQIDTEVGSIVFALKLADSTYNRYTIKFPFITDDEVAQITWSDGTKNVDKFTAEGYVSCGRVASNNSILDLTDIETRLTESGKTDTGDSVYKVASTDAVMKKAYDNYKRGRSQDMLTLEQFATKNTVFIWQSKIGVYVVFTNRDFGGMAECGKPVIYLYPQKTTKVSVKVDAKITKSDPAYNDGWQVLAEPSGRLTVAGKVYNSLFWEGTGYEYPQLNQGVVVSSTEAINIIKTQLIDLGLNQKEVAEFVEYWAPKMPSTPYVRLTWFDTSIMDKLAPLSITPQPNSIIRVFLDFEGLSTKVDLKPQVLSAPARQGFTVVEWGGLLRR